VQIANRCEQIFAGDEIGTQLAVEQEQQQPNERDDYNVPQFRVAVERSGA